jgi:hypothetical protein
MLLRIFDRKAIVLPMALISLLTASAAFVPSSESPGVAQAQGGYTLASLQGTFACPWIVGAQVGAGFGVYTLDGNGNYTSASDIANMPTPEGGRQLIPFTDVGTYQVNANGTVVLSSTYTFPDGSSVKRSWDFVVTQAVRSSVGASLVATEFSGMQREPSLTGDLMTCVCKRLPDEGVFTSASIKGTWAYTITGGSNAACAAGTATIRENGNFSGPFIMNAPAPDGSRLVIPGTAAGTAPTLKEDGTGLFSGATTLPDGSTNQWTLDFVITQAEVVGGVKVATEMFAIQREPGFGLFWTYTFKRLPD